MLDKKENLTSNDESKINKLRQYSVKKSEGIFRVFKNLGINYNKNTEKNISKISDLMKAKNGLKEGDAFILDNDFNIHVKRDWEYILHFPLIEVESKKQEKESIKKYTSSKLNELVEQLDEQNRLKYYTEIVLEKELWWAITKDDMTALYDDIEKDEKEHKKPKTLVQKNSADERKNKKPVAKKTKKEEVHKMDGKIISANWRKKLLEHIEKINNKFVVNYKFIEEMSNKYKLKPALLIAVIQNDTWMWKYLISKNNVANVWNDDSWKRVHFKSPRSWIEALAKNLRKRVDSYYEKFPNRNPTVKELMTWFSKDNIKYYWPYMTNSTWPQTVAMIYDKIK